MLLSSGYTIGATILRLIIVTFSLLGLTMWFGGCKAAIGGHAPGISSLLPAPTGITATAGNAQISLAWTNVTGGISYNVYWSTTTGVTKLNGTKITGVANPYLHTALTNGIPYYYIVTTVNADGESIDSATTSVAPALPPAAPTNLSAVSGNTQATLSMSAAAGATSYNLYWSTSTGVTKSNGTKITGATLSYIHTGRTNEVAYYYVATAVNSSGESDDSAQVGVVPTASSNTWTTKTPMAPFRFANSVAGIINLLYAVGGTNYGCGPYATLEVYDPATNLWSAKTSMTVARWSLRTGVVNNILYAVGGTNACSNPATGMTTVEAYSPATDTWATKAPMPIARADHAVGVVGGILYALGGYTSAVPVNSMDAYNPLTNTWTSKAPMSTVRNGPGVGVVGGLLYVIGGNDAIVVLSSVEVYNPGTNSWSSKAAMPTARTSLAVEVVNGIIYAIGGNNGTSTVSTVEAYNPATNTWSTVAPMLTSRSAPAAGVVNNIIYAVGGITSTPIPTVEAYAP